jgi:hypothetical protein
MTYTKGSVSSAGVLLFNEGLGHQPDLTTIYCFLMDSRI